MSDLKYEINNCAVCGKPHGFCICEPKKTFEYAINILDEELKHKKSLLLGIVYEINKNTVRDIIYELDQAISILQKAGVK